MPQHDWTDWAIGVTAPVPKCLTFDLNQTFPSAKQLLSSFKEYSVWITTMFTTFKVTAISFLPNADSIRGAHIYLNTSMYHFCDMSYQAMEYFKLLLIDSTYWNVEKKCTTSRGPFVSERTLPLEIIKVSVYLNYISSRLTRKPPTP